MVACSCIVLTMTAPELLSGQQDVRWRVVSEGLGPIPAVQVELWGRAVHLGSVTSDADGRFTIGAALMRELVRVSLHHLGFRTQILQTEALLASDSVVLSPLPVELNGLSVVVEGCSCPRDDEVEARAVWEGARRRYQTSTGFRGGAIRYFGSIGPVRETELFSIDQERMALLVTKWTGSAWPPEAGMFPLLEGLVRQLGYAWHRVSSRLRYLNWTYPELDGRHAYHFATDAFGGLHTFHVLSRRNDQVVLGFCPLRGSDMPTVTGTLTVVPGGGLLEAEWSFDTPEPDEEAGGRVVFVDFMDGTSSRPHLVAGRGIFFRHNGKPAPFPDLPRSYLRDARISVNWAISPGSEMPALPPRDSSLIRGRRR